MDDIIVYALGVLFVFELGFRGEYVFHKPFGEFTVSATDNEDEGRYVSASERRFSMCALGIRTYPSWGTGTRAMRGRWVVKSSVLGVCTMNRIDVRRVYRSSQA